MSTYLQYGQLPFSYINGLKLSNNATTPNSKLDISTGICIDSTNTFQITTSSVITGDITQSGLNGLDTGTVAASTLYYVYLVWDPVSSQTPGMLFSASATPLMPYDYGAYRLIGYVATDGSSHLLKGYWTNADSSSRLFMYDAPQATAITAGNATSYTAVSLSALVPAVSNTPVWMYSAFTPGAASRQLFMQPYGATGDSVIITGQVTSVVVSSNSLVLARLNTAAPSVSYKVSNSGDAAALKVAGYQFIL